MPLVFISHSNHAGERTPTLVELLRREGFGVWVDYENARGSADWLCEIQAGIKRCDALVVMLSSAAGKSGWVEREVLHAFQLRKPIFTALVDDARLPLHLINIPCWDCRGRMAEGAAALAGALKVCLSRADPINYERAEVSSAPMEANFFPYIGQLPQGDSAAMVALDLFNWARRNLDELAFSGKSHPACHARLALRGRRLTLLTIWAFPKTPSLQLPLAYLAAFPPYKSKKSRRGVLKKLNQLLPQEARLPASAADRRPTFPLLQLDAAEKRAAFKAVLGEISENLRGKD